MVFFNKQYPKRKRATGGCLALTRDHVSTGQGSPIDDEEQELRKILMRDIGCETVMEAHKREIADGGHAEHDGVITNSICQQAIAEMSAKYNVQIPPGEAATALKVLPKVQIPVYSDFKFYNTYNACSMLPLPPRPGIVVPCVTHSSSKSSGIRQMLNLAIMNTYTHATLLGGILTTVSSGPPMH